MSFSRGSGGFQGAVWGAVGGVRVRGVRGGGGGREGVLGDPGGRGGRSSRAVLWGLWLDGDDLGGPGRVLGQSWGKS